MATVAALFGTQAQASQIVDDLADGEFADADVRVVENAPQDFSDPDITALPHLGDSRLSGVPDTGVTDWFDDVDHEALDEFFLDGVRGGGVLILAKVDEEQAERLETFFRERGGRTSAK